MAEPGTGRPGTGTGRAGPQTGRARGGPLGTARERWKLLLRVLRGSVTSRPRDAGWLALWSAVQALPALASGWVVAKATGDFLTGWPGTPGGLGWLGLLGLAAAVGALASGQTYRRVAALVEPVRDELIRVIVTGALRRATADSGPRDTGAVARITHQADIVRNSLAGLLLVCLTFAFSVVSTLVGLATLVPAALPYTVGPIVPSLALFCCLMPSMARRQCRSIVSEEAVAGSVSRALTGLRDVIACGAESQVRADIMGRVTEQAAALRAVARMNMLRTLCLAIGGWLPLVLVLAATPSLARQGVGPAAMVGAVIYIGGSLRGALSSVTRGLGGTGIRLSITLQRIAEASGSALDPSAWGGGQPAERPRPDPAVSGTGQVSLRNVTFAYGPHAEPVLRDLCLDVPAGDHLAIVGPSGIGKSTLAGLAAGLLRPRAGEVWLDGLPMSAIPVAELPGHRVLIPQEAYVFDGTLGENLRYLAPDAAEADLDASAGAVGLRAVVTRLGGYGGNVTPAALSAGERQLIALARAHLSPARIAILDEATCHLDPDATARAENAFAARPGTLIVIAHRISSALRARRVLVLDGTRAEIGSHAELLARSPMYRDLVGHWQEAHREAHDDPAAGEGQLAIRW
jgi:ATP-binding cassette, subfamily C, bacterial